MCLCFVYAHWCVCVCVSLYVFVCVLSGRWVCRRGAHAEQGPFTLSDYVGLDTTLAIVEGWKKNFPQVCVCVCCVRARARARAATVAVRHFIVGRTQEPAFVVPETLKKLVKEGKFGRKSGQGVFKWEGNKRV